MVRFIVVAFMFVAACDPLDASRPGGSEKTVPTVEAAAPANGGAHGLAPASVAPAQADPAAPRSEFSSCLLGCDAAKVSHAEKATCRSDCERPGAPPAVPGADEAVIASDPVEYVTHCMDRCYSEIKGSDGCLTACKRSGAGLPASPSAAVLDDLGTCLGTCRAGKHISATNRATCELNCTQTARIAGPAQGSAAVAQAR